MKITTAVVLCVLILGFVGLMLGGMFISNVSSRIDQLTDAFEKPGIASNLTVDKISFVSEEAEFVLEGFSTSVNSRIIDLIGEAVAVGVEAY